MLGGLGLHLVGRGDIRHERHVDEQHVARAGLLLELACRLDERQSLDVADGAPDLRDDDVGTGLLGRAADPLLDGLGHVRDDLHGAAEEIAAPLAGDERLVDGALGEVALAGEVLVDEALVVAEIQIALVAVFGDEHLAVLEGAHGARVNVQVRIHLLHGHFVAARLQKLAQRSGGDALAQRRDDASGNEDVLGHTSLLIIASESLAMGQRACCGLRA